jgi:hypothetical protein
LNQIAYFLFNGQNHLKSDSYKFLTFFEGSLYGPPPFFPQLARLLANRVRDSKAGAIFPGKGLAGALNSALAEGTLLLSAWPAPLGVPSFSTGTCQMFI